MQKSVPMNQFLNNPLETIRDPAPAPEVELLNLLGIEKNSRQADWSTKVTSFVGMSCNEFNKLRIELEASFNESDRDRSIYVLSIIQLAKNYGIKEAKKRQLNVSILEKSIPISLNDLLHTSELKIAAIQALSIIIKPNWVEQYVLDSIRDSEDSKVVWELFNWLFKRNSSVKIFIEKISSPKHKPQVFADSDWVLIIFQYLFKVIEKNPKSFDYEVLNSLTKLLSHYNLGINHEVGKLSIQLINFVADDNPFVLTVSSVPTLLMLCGIVKNTETASYKAYKALCERVCGFLVGIYIYGMSECQLNDARLIWTQYKLGLVDADSNALIKRMALTDNQASELFAADKQRESQINDGTIEKCVAELFVIWDEFDSSDSESAAALRNMKRRLNDLQRVLNLDAVGNLGESIAYDPLTQQLINYRDVSIPIVSVRVVSRGFTQRRSNGSLRVVKKAIVET
jgi:hypothetical protein